MEKEKFFGRDMTDIDTTLKLGASKTIASLEWDGIGISAETNRWMNVASDQVDVEYKGKEYLYWEDFPKELQDLIQKDENWRENKDVTVHFEPEIQIEYDGFEGAENYGHEAEDEAVFLGKSKEEIHQYLSVCLMELTKKLAEQQKHSFESYRQEAIPKEWRLIKAGKDPVTEGMVEGAVASVAFYDGKNDPYKADWSKDETYLCRTENTARRIANFDKQDYYKFLHAFGNDKVLEDIKKAGNADELRAAVMSTFESYLSEVRPADPSPLTKGVEKLLRNQNWKKIRKMLMGFVKGGKKAKEDLVALGKSTVR